MQGLLCTCTCGLKKCSSLLQLTAVDGRRAFVTLPNDPELVDILARNGVDISVSEGDQQGNYVSLLGAHLLSMMLLLEAVWRLASTAVFWSCNAS